MARTINDIAQDLYTKLVDRAAEVGVIIDPSIWSDTDIRKLTADITAVAHSTQEQIYDSSLQDLESVADKLPIQIRGWFYDQMINVFEYDSAAVPIVQLSPDFVPYYPNPNPNFRIVKYCSVVPGYFGTVVIKIAGTGPSQISGTALDAAQSFVNIIGIPGIDYNVESKISDKLFLQIDVYYNGLYSAVIQSTVISAINSYLKGISFDGVVTLLDLSIAIKNVTGVNDVVFFNVIARDDASLFGSGSNLVTNYAHTQKDFQTIAGYIIPETTVGKTLTDFRSGSSGPLNLNLIPQ